MPDVPPPNLSDANSPSVRQVFALFGRGLVYAVAFWLVYFGLLRLYPPFGSAGEDKLQRQSEQMKTYDKQAQRAAQLFVEAERQQSRTNAVISKQEEQAKRLDAILERWERQSGIRK